MIRHEVMVLLAWEFREWLHSREGDFFTAFSSSRASFEAQDVLEACQMTLGEFLKEQGDDRFYWYFDHPYFRKHHGVKASFYLVI